MTKTMCTDFGHRHAKEYVRIAWIVNEDLPGPGDQGIFTTASIRWVSLEQSGSSWRNGKMKQTQNRNDWLGMSWRWMPKLPLLTANIDVKATMLSWGWGILSVRETSACDLLRPTEHPYWSVLWPPSISKNPLFGRVNLCGTLIHR